MAGRPSGEKSATKGGLAGVGLAAVMVACCAALPLFAALAGSVALGTLLGVGAGAVAAVVLGGLVVAGVRRRRACRVDQSALRMLVEPRSEEARR